VETDKILKNHLHLHHKDTDTSKGILYWKYYCCDYYCRSGPFWWTSTSHLYTWLSFIIHQYTI